MVWIKTAASLEVEEVIRGAATGVVGVVAGVDDGGEEVELEDPVTRTGVLSIVAVPTMTGAPVA